MLFFKSYKQTHFKTIVFVFVMQVLACLSSPAQFINFTRVYTGNGLSDNLVYEACRDKNGLIWIATSLGLNTYNGFEVRNWQHITDSAFTTRDFRSVYCDGLNNVWIKDANGKLGFLNYRRELCTVLFSNKTDSGAVRYLFPASGNRLFCLVKSKLLKLDRAKNQWHPVASLPDSVMKFTYMQEATLPNDCYLLPGSDRLLRINLQKGTVEKVARVKKIIGAVLLPNGNYLVSTGKNSELFSINPVTGVIEKNYGLLPDQYGKPVNGYLRTMAIQADGKVVITSGYGGVYVFDPIKETLLNYAHDPLNDVSVSGNNTFIVSADADGYVFITSRSSGLSYYNVFQQQASTRSIIRNAGTSSLYDGYIGSITADSEGKIWMGGQGGLLCWNELLNAAAFYDYGVINGESITGKEEIRVLYFDKQGRLWVGLNRYGVVVLDQQKNPIRYFSREATDSTQRIAGNFILDIKDGPDGKIWVASNSGMSVIDPATLHAQNMDAYPELKKIAKRQVNQFYKQNKTNWWMATTIGAFHWNTSNRTLGEYSSKNGLANQSVLSITGDAKGNIYTGGRNGFEILKRVGQANFVLDSTSLKAYSCQSMVTDSTGNIWIANDNNLVCFQPITGRYLLFDKSHGFTGSGFRLNSVFAAKAGVIYMGCNKGFSFFNPNKLVQQVNRFNVVTAGVSAGSLALNFTGYDSISLPFSNNSPVFTIEPVELSGSNAWQVEYQLQGYDTGWLPFTLQQPVLYQHLPPGNYSFALRYKLNNGAWLNGSNIIFIEIQKAWWQQWWFRLLAASALAILLFAFLNERRKMQLRKRADAETENAIRYLTSSMHEQVSVEEMLWDITRNCIARLGFEDCVIYLLDADNNMLYQKAAWGPKTTEENKIINAIKLPLGKGIVGAVAQSGKAVIISDTTTDSRYVVDDLPRLSEITVPIIADGQVLGVIDSEHSKKDFFTQRHLSILSTIASLLGSKIITAKTAEEKRTAEIALLENKQRTSEVEMKALRAQMNPHFMFNSLNSINNFILKNDTDNASAYLTRFARLMRSILDNSREEWVSLENELKALQLYIEMESLRFDNVFEYEIDADKTLDLMSIFVPPMLVQPYVENAIWHGLLHRKMPGSHLGIKVTKINGYLHISIADNGIGRAAAAAMKSKFGTHKQSHGMQITAERLQIVNEIYGIDAQATIEDIIMPGGEIEGTLVTLTMKPKNHESNNH